MCYVIIPTEQFEKDIKYYQNKKKYKSIVDDLNDIIEELEKGNLLGDCINDIKLDNENHTYKVRAANSDIKVGKSNGYRLIYYVVKDDKEIYLLTVYFKKEDKQIPNKDDIRKLIEEYCA